VLRVDSAIESFRAAAMLPINWPHALDAFAEAFDSDGATVVLKATTASSIAVSTSIKPVVEQYLHGPIRDPRETRVWPTLSQGFMPDHAYFSAQEIAREPYYQEFLKPCGFGWNATAKLHGDLMVSVKRSFKRGPYAGAELQALNRAVPWLRSVSRTASLAWQSQFSGHLKAFERLHRGALLLDAAARVLQMNACVRTGDGFDIVGGFLQVPNGVDQQRLHRFLAALLCKDNQTLEPAATILTLPRPSGARPWLLDGVTCNDAMRSLHSNAAAMVLITDLDRAKHPNVQVLRQLFDLTPIECSIVDWLLCGESLQDIAARMSISEGHARQRLQSIFGKTQTARQGELIALLAKLD
jgi:DNA-binding CsgD family transcriptional regulator